MLNRQAKLKQSIENSLLCQVIGTENVLIQKQREHDRKEGSPALWPIRVIDILKPKMETDTVLLCITHPPPPMNRTVKL